MARLLTLQQNILKNYGGNVSIGLELAFHEKHYDYKNVIKKLEKRKIQAITFPYEISKRYPVNILPPDKASQVAVNMLAMNKKANDKMNYYPISGHWYLLADEKLKSLSMWTASIEYTQDFMNDIEVAFMAIFKLLTGSPHFYTMAMRLELMNLIRQVVDGRIEKIEPLTIDMMRGGFIFPLRITQPYYAISALPQGEPLFVVANQDGVYVLQYHRDIEMTTVKLMTKDLTLFNEDDLPFIILGYEVPPMGRINGGMHLKGHVYVVNDCLMRGGSSFANKSLDLRLNELDQIKLNMEPDNDQINFIVPMQREARTPQTLFQNLQDLLSKRDSLFYRTAGVFFRQSQEYSRHTSYEWRQNFPITTLLSMDTKLLVNYHLREKKRLLDFPPQNFKKSMILFDTTDNPDPSAWSHYYQIYTRDKNSISDNRVVLGEPDEKVHVIYAETITEKDYALIDNKLMDGGFLILKLVEEDILHSFFISHSQYEDKIALPDPSLGEITLTKVSIDKKEYPSSSLKKLIASSKYEIIQNYILDRELVLNSTEEYLTRAFSGIVLRKGDAELKELRDPIHEEIKVEVIEEFEPLPEVNILPKPFVEEPQSANPKLPMPSLTLKSLSGVIPITQGPNYKPTLITVPGSSTPKLSPVVSAPRRAKMTVICQHLEPGDKKDQWELMGLPARRFGSIADGSCLIHTILTATDEQYPILRKKDPELDRKIRRAKRIAQKNREVLAKEFTPSVYKEYDFEKLGKDFSYQRLKKELADPSAFIGHEMVDYISTFYDINIIFFTCAEDSEKYVRYRDGRNFKDYPKREWIFILWVRENHFELIGLIEDKQVNFLFPYDDERIEKLFT